MPKLQTVLALLLLALVIGLPMLASHNRHPAPAKAPSAALERMRSVAEARAYRAKVQRDALALSARLEAGE